jgi:hypothetical protein
MNQKGSDIHRSPGGNRGLNAASYLTNPCFSSKAILERMIALTASALVALCLQDASDDAMKDLVRRLKDAETKVRD